MDWRPIEIAPKDGKPILGTEPIDGGRWVTRVLSFSELNNCWRAMPGEYPYRPTHWMPLPDPPGTKGEKALENEK